jgi:serine/threonine-protein kinase/endoribonuclease IRE1
MAGISKETGQVLWKHSESSASGSSPTTLGSKSTPNIRVKKENDNNSSIDASQILQPLVSTTTTTKSASSANYAVVPSIDGTVFATSNDMTESTSVKELVARSPFLDPKGRRFYVGSRHTTAAALDMETGEILRVVSAANAKSANEAAPSLEGRNIVWIGRVDHTVSVQDARSGIMDAQFSVAEVMSVADMQGMARKQAWTPERLLAGHSRRHSGGNGALPAFEDEPFDTAILSAAGLPAVSNSDAEITSTLVATPNGNVAFYDVGRDMLIWAANESFDSPIAFAMDASTGLPIEVDIIPDVIDPNGDSDHVRRQMEYQLVTSSAEGILEDQTIVGAMANGQLYALPLGLKATAAIAGPTSSISSSSSAAAVASSGSGNTKHASHVSHLPGRPNANFHDSRHNQALLLNNYHHHNEQFSTSKRDVVAGKKPCVPSNPLFPSCLVRRADLGRHKLSSEVASPLGNGDYVWSQGRWQRKNEQENSLAIMTSQFQDDNGGFYHPDFGYVSPQDFYRMQQRLQNKFSYRKMFYWFVTSWLPPLALSIFVVSFELGRRKRLRDEKRRQEEPLLKLESADEGNVVMNLQGENKLAEIGAKASQNHVISVSDEVLGYGGHGTVVYKGVLDGRDVAVKRMLKAYHASADREISLLIESDGDPNVVRYFLKEIRGDFVYLALELCDLSLHDLIGILREHQQQRLVIGTDGGAEEHCADDSEILSATKRILFQIASGVKHLHSLRIVHRDLKPANILCAISKKGKKKGKSEDPIFDAFIHDFYVPKISDMGLGKQLLGQSSLGASFIGDSSLRGSKGIAASSVGVGPGTVGWQAPEVMAMRLTSDMSAQSNDSGSTALEAKKGNDHQTNARTSRSVDIFSLGCIFYSVLIPGSHPFGEWFERESNIMYNKPNLDALKSISIEAFDLVCSMLERNPRWRPTAKEVCEHPFFWSPQKRLAFLCDFSDRLETDNLQQTTPLNTLAIERGAVDVVGTSWEAKLDSALVDNVQKFRTYDYSSVRDLLRLIRNKHHHFDELPEDFRVSSVPDHEALCKYFEEKYPALVMHCYNFCQHQLSAGDALLTKYEIRPAAKLDQSALKASTAPVSVVVKQDSITEEPEQENSSKAAAAASNMGSPEPEHIDRNDEAVVELHVEAEKLAGEEEKVTIIQDAAVLSVPESEDIIIWEGSAAAKAFNCRGWSRSDDHWSRHIEPFYKKRDPALKRALEDPKFRTRLCNHWDVSLGTNCPMKKKNKCVFAHGPAELRVKEGKKNRWGKLVDKNGNSSNPWHSGGEDTYGPASSVEKVRKDEGKWNTRDKRKPAGAPAKNANRRSTPQKKDGHSFSPAVKA